MLRLFYTSPTKIREEIKAYGESSSGGDDCSGESKIDMGLLSIEFQSVFPFMRVVVVLVMGIMGLR